MNSGQIDEYNFWHTWIIKYGKIYSNTMPLIRSVEEMIVHKDSKIANLGSGAFSLIGDVSTNVENVNIRIYASDFLAEEYKTIYNEFQIFPYIPIEYQDMTCLTYPNEFFDVVYCRNALDHCSDPLKAINEMFRVCKTNGQIYLEHELNEGQNENYNGLHQWNIDIMDNIWFIWKPGGIYMEYTYKWTNTVLDGWIISKIRKE